MENKVTLYIATHNSTGLKYFGKTIRYFTKEKLQEKYHGSGVYWSNHLKKHGDDVTMEIYGIFSLNEQDDNYVVPIALKFSEENKISDKHNNWANQIPENGLGGNYFGNDRLVPNISCVDIIGNHVVVSCDDPKFLSGEYISIHKGTKPHKNNRKAVSESNSGMAVYKDSTGNTIRASIIDERVLNGELVGIHKNTRPHNALDIIIYNSRDEIINICEGNFIKYCRENDLPSSALRNSYNDGGTPIFTSNLCRIKESRLKCKGWYARIIPTD